MLLLGILPGTRYTIRDCLVLKHAVVSLVCMYLVPGTCVSQDASAVVDECIHQ